MVCRFMFIEIEEITTESRIDREFAAPRRLHDVCIGDRYFFELMRNGTNDSIQERLGR